jgi:hypothetical protein
MVLTGVLNLLLTRFVRLSVLTLLFFALVRWVAVGSGAIPPRAGEYPPGGLEPSEAEPGDGSSDGSSEAIERRDSPGSRSP